MFKNQEQMNNEKTALPIGEKYLLSIKEAASYFNIGEKSSAALPRTINAALPTEDFRFIMETGCS